VFILFYKKIIVKEVVLMLHFNAAIFMASDKVMAWIKILRMLK
jgi:hypothetical protein